MKAIIFGVNGQDGFYLNKLLVEKKYSVIGVSRSTGIGVCGDVKDLDFVSSLIKTNQPDIVFHLAANSTTRHDVIFENHDTISTGTLNILESVYQYNRNCKVFLSGSAMQFRNNGSPINEQTPFEASSPYSVARIHSVYAARYFRSLGLHIYTGYFFNHESPLRTPRHVSRMITDAVKRIHQGSTEKITLGDIKVKKEWNFAGDFANAIYTLTAQENIFESVIGCGIAYSIENWLETCFRSIDKDWTDFVTLKEGFKPEYNILVSDPALLYTLGYKPKVDFEQLATLMLEN